MPSPAFQLNLIEFQAYGTLEKSDFFLTLLLQRCKFPRFSGDGIFQFQAFILQTHGDQSERFVHTPGAPADGRLYRVVRVLDCWIDSGMGRIGGSG